MFLRYEVTQGFQQTQVQSTVQKVCSTESVNLEFRTGVVGSLHVYLSF